MKLKDMKFGIKIMDMNKWVDDIGFFGEEYTARSIKFSDSGKYDFDFETTKKILLNIVATNKVAVYYEENCTGYIRYLPNGNRVDGCVLRPSDMVNYILGYEFFYENEDIVPLYNEIPSHPINRYYVLFKSTESTNAGDFIGNASIHHDYPICVNGTDRRFFNSNELDEELEKIILSKKEYFEKIILKAIPSNSVDKNFYIQIKTNCTDYEYIKNEGQFSYYPRSNDINEARVFSEKEVKDKLDDIISYTDHFSPIVVKVIPCDKELKYIETPIINDRYQYMNDPIIKHIVQFYELKNNQNYDSVGRYLDELYTYALDDLYYLNQFVKTLIYILHSETNGCAREIKEEKDILDVLKNYPLECSICLKMLHNINDK